MTTGEDILTRVFLILHSKKEEMSDAGSPVTLETDYIELFHRDTFEPVRDEIARGEPLVLAGAIRVGKTRLIDNVLLGWSVE